MEEPNDLAAQHEAAKDYQPALEGPPVGEKTTSDAITHEYAKADPVYVEKTVALPQTYSHYRPIQGDGNCGWRAIGFSYFEKLVEAGDSDRIGGEVARLMSLNHTLSTVGGYSYFEDWADEMTGLLRELAAIVTDGPAAHGLLLQRWNDAAVEGGLIYYLRLLAATYLKANASTYDPFVPDGQGVQAYCSQSVELVNREIEHLGIVALANILLKPAGIALEIAYLDRSPGGRVNNHRFADEGEQVIYLLYRPDHYDILYRAPAARPVAMQVRSLSHDVRIAPSSASLAAYSSLDLDVLAMIPGFTAVVPLMAMPTPEGPEAEPLAPTDGASPWPPTFLDGPPTPVPPLATTSVLARCPLEAPACPIRFSPVQLEYDESNGGFGEANFQAKTSAFKNSVWNRAHYGNSHFHPEEWTPLDEDKGKRRRAKDA